MECKVSGLTISSSPCSIIDLVIDLWLSFASNPEQDPTDGQGTVWPKYDSSTDSMLEFAANDTWAQTASGSIVDSFCS